MPFRTEAENGIEYRIVEFNGRIPGGEGIEFIDAQKVWSHEYRYTSGIGIMASVDLLPNRLHETMRVYAPNTEALCQ